MLLLRLVDPRAAHALLSNAGLQSFSVERRITRRSEFEQTFRAKRVTNKWFIAYIRKNEGPQARLGLVVSKRVMPRAVTRNYAKRLIREAFRQSAQMLPALDIVVRPRCPIKPGDAAEGRQALTHLLSALQE